MEILRYVNEDMYLDRYDMQLFIYNKFAIAIKDKEEYEYVINKLKEYIAIKLCGTINKIDLNYEDTVKNMYTGELCVVIEKPGAREQAILNLPDYSILFSDKDYIIEERYKIIKFKQLIL